MVPLGYGPPMSDSEDSDYSEDSEFGGFHFGDEDPYKKKKSIVYKPEINPETELYNTVVNGDLSEMVQKMSELSFEINNRVDYGHSLLHYASRYGHIDIVQYLLDNGADSNCQIESITPIMEACSTYKQKPENTIKVVQLLLDNGAIINISDKYGVTPLMYACESGFLDVIKLLIPNANLDACDNEGKTIIFYAIEKNHIEIVKFLIEYGVNCEVFDRKGYKPIHMASNHGFLDICELLPKEKLKYEVPMTFTCYNSVRDHIPSIFLKTEIPEYFQEVYAILNEINMSKFTDKFALAKIDLAEFLTITDKRLEEIGIDYPFQRNRIHLGLLHFHLNHWSRKKIAKVKGKDEPDNFYDILMLSANHLQNLIILNSTIKYVEQNLTTNKFGNVKIEKIKSLRKCAKGYKDILNKLNDTVKYLQSFSPEKPPLYIEYDDRKKQPNKFVCCLKYSILVGIGISLVICFKVKSTFLY